MLNSAKPSYFYRLRVATAEDFEFAEKLTCGNMHGYYQRHGFVWRSDLFFLSWCESENFMLELADERIGVLRVRQEGRSLHIHDIQISGSCQQRGAGTYLLTTSHRLARERGLGELQLYVFADNPAVQLYLRMGYRVSDSQAGSLRKMVRAV